MFARPALCKSVGVPNESQTLESSRSTFAISQWSCWRQSWAIISETFRNWDKDNVSRLAAALSCYTLLSIAPLGILSVALAGAVFGQQAARGQIAAAIGPAMGTEVGRAIETIIVNARVAHSGLSSTAFGVVVLLLGASGVFAELQSAMNTIWKVEPKAGRGVLTFIRHRLFSFAMVLAVAFLLLVSLIVSAALAAFGKFFEKYLPGGELVWQVVNVLGSLAVATALFALVFRVVPDIDLEWKNVWPGAFATALLFTLGKLLLGLYIGKSSVTSSYGAAGSLVALVVWVYYSSQIVFLGAELTHTYSRRKAGPS
jgi:membrane protein